MATEADPPDLKHAHAAGVVGGNSVCGATDGSVTDREPEVTCPTCIRSVGDYLRSKGWTEQHINVLFGLTNG